MKLSSNIKNTLTSFLMSLFLLVLIPSVSYASGVQVTPRTFDLKAKVRDTIQLKLRLKSSHGTSLTLVPGIDDLDGYGTERWQSLAQWFNIFRGEYFLMPGESRDVEFYIEVSPHAKPGFYHARLNFGGGPESSVLINLDLTNTKEDVRLIQFAPLELFSASDGASFVYALENKGDTLATHGGEIRIHDRSGKERAAIKVNPKMEALLSGQSGTYSATTTTTKLGFGKYKAYLDVNYGRNGTASLQDTVYFWVLPWKQLLLGALILFATIVFLTHIYHDYHYGNGKRKKGKISGVKKRRKPARLAHRIVRRKLARA